MAAARSCVLLFLCLVSLVAQAGVPPLTDEDDRSVAEPRDAPPQAVQSPLVFLEDIRFERGEAVILEESYPVLDAAIKAFRVLSDLRVRIEAHTATAAPLDRHPDLAQRRAEAVKAYLIEHGQLSGDRFVTTPRAQVRRVADREELDGQAAQERVEWILLDEPAAHP